MSADDFQTKYASFMESIVKSTIAETRKLFETMVDELKSELSKVKKENEALKTTSREKENAKTLSTTESCQWDGPDMRDSAVQCDLLPGHPLLTVQCQPMGQSADDQKHQRDQEELVYTLMKDHDYDAAIGHSPLTKPEVSEATVGSKEVCAVTDSASSSPGGTETEGPQIDQQCSYGVLSKCDEGLVTTVQPSLEWNCNLHQSHNQSVNSLSALSNSMEVASLADQMSSDFGIKGCSGCTTFKEPSAAPQAQIERRSLSETPGNEQANVTVVQHSGVPLAEEQQAEPTLLKKQLEGAQIKCGSTKDKTNIETGKLPVKKNRRERKQPSNKVKHLQKTPSKRGAGHDEAKSSPSTSQNRALDMENPNAAPPIVSVVSLSETGVSPESQQPCMEMDKVSSRATSGDFPLHSHTAASLPAPSCKLRERSTSVTLQDAMLLVEAMDQSTKNCASPEETTAQSTCTLHVVTLPSEAQSPLPPQALSPPTPQVLEEIPTAEQSTNTSSDFRCDTTVVQQQNCVTPPNVITSVSSLTSTVGESLERHSPSSPVPWQASLQTQRDSVLNKIIVVPRSSSLSLPCSHPPRTIAPLSPTQISAVVSTVAAAQNKYSSSLGLSERKSVTYSTTAETTISSIEPKSHTHTQIKIIIPRPTLAVVASQTQPLEATILITQQNSVGPASDDPMSTSQSTHVCRSSQIISDGKEKSSATAQIPFILSPVSPPQLDLEVTHPEDAEASLTESVPICSFPVTLAMAGSKTPPLSTKPAVVPELRSPESELSEVAKTGDTSSVVDAQASNPTPEASALSTSLGPASKETSAAGGLSESPVSENMSSPAMLEEEPATCVPPCSPFSEHQPVSPKSTIDIDEAELSPVPHQPSEASPNMNEEIMSNVKQAPPIQLTPITPKDLSDPRSQWTKTQFLAQLAVIPVNQDPQKVSTNQFAGGQATEDRTSADHGRKFQKKSIVARLRSHLKMHSLAKRTVTNAEPLTGKQHCPVSTKEPPLENVGTTDPESTESIPVCTKGPSELQTETGYSQATLKKQRNTDISLPERTTIQTVPVCPKDPAVSKDVRSLKNRTNSTLIISPLPETEVNITQGNPTQLPLDNDRVKKGAPTEAKPRNAQQQIIAQECASKKLECSVYLSSILDKNGRIKTHLPPLSGCRSTPCNNNATSEMSGDANLGPKSVLTEEMETPFPAMVSGKSSTSKDELSSNKSKATTVCLRSSTTKDSSSPHKTAFPPGSRKRCISAQENAVPKKTQTNCPHQDRSAHKKTETLRPRPTRDYARSNKSHLPAVTPKESNFMKNGSRSKKSCSESLGGPNLTKEEHTSKQLKRESSSISGNTGPAGPQAAKLPANDTSPSKTGEAIAKKSRLGQNCSISENVKLRNALKLATAAKAKTENVKLRNAQKLAKAAKATTIAKMNKSRQSKLNKMSQAADRCASEETGNKGTMETTSLRGKASLLSPVQKEARSPGSQNHTVVSPPSLPHQPIPVSAASIASPLQPLTLIGSRLLKNQCGECGRVLSSGAALESHISLHTGHRPFCCALCGKSFPDAKGLRRHGRVHRNGRIHICQQCGKGFVYGFGLAKHVQMVHGKIKPFVCQICNKAFFTKRDVEDHIRIHTGEKPFHCHLCEKKFVRKVELKVHLRWHNGEKRHWCPYCGKGFLDYNNLKRHKLIHTGEKPHSCPHCPKHFTQSGHLKKHVRNVHKVQ
ncbi:mucin-2 [Dunckerocampus dactyliophorus]|uniref:mucin-2 n=1 Tax=Dunckerocampus dactyliophorus TaxID=161453 RepID=UPI002406F4E4|nr:mucin-2 [Dunckerocampus dactyliophorus]